MRIIADELNVKKAEYVKNLGNEIQLDTNLTEELKVEGALREMIRTINGMRKDAGLTINDRVKIIWQSEGEIARKVFADSAMSDELLKSVLAESATEAKSEAKPVNINGEKVSLEVEKI